MSGKNTFTSPREVEERFGVPTPVQAKMRMEGRICPYTKVGKRVLYVNFEEWLLNQTAQAHAR